MKLVIMSHINNNNKEYIAGETIIGWVCTYLQFCLLKGWTARSCCRCGAVNFASLPVICLCLSFFIHPPVLDLIWFTPSDLRPLDIDKFVSSLVLCITELSSGRAFMAAYSSNAFAFYVVSFSIALQRDVEWFSRIAARYYFWQVCDFPLCLTAAGNDWFSRRTNSIRFGKRWRS